MPTPTPVVSLHPLIPAAAIGTPTTKQNPIHTTADGDVDPSDAGPCGTAARVSESTTVTFPSACVDTTTLRATIPTEGEGRYSAFTDIKR